SPAEGRSGRDFFHEGLDGLDPAIVDLEHFPYRELALAAHQRAGAEVHAQPDDAELLVDGGNLCGDAGQCGNTLLAHALTTGKEGAARPGHQLAVLKTVGLFSKLATGFHKTAN